MINLPALCIRRPVFTAVISLVILIMGLVGFMTLPIRWIPNVSPPALSIETIYPGANASLVEQDVTKVIESSLSGVDGVETISSVSRQGFSNISLTFRLGKNMDSTVADVRSNLERVRGALPKEAESPAVSKSDPNSNPILYVTFYDEKMSGDALGDYIDKFVLPSFESIDGVGRVDVYGKRVTAIYVRLDPQKLAGANMTAAEVGQFLQNQTASIPGGQIRSHDRYYSVLTESTLKTPEQFNHLIIHDQDNQVIRLDNVGMATEEPEDTDSAFRINGKPAIAIGVVPQSSANPLDVERQVKKVFNELKKTLPEGMAASINYNQTDYIRDSIKSVYESFAEALLFVWLVILLFLSDFRATFIPVITIPVCLIGTCFILYMLGFSINTITLMAFVLAIGLVVDDAIVMLENISRYREQGLSAYDAAMKGSREIIFPIIAMTITLAAVYAPIAFTPGLLGVLFREFTFTLAGAVLLSGLIALTLTPMMCSRVLKQSHTHPWLDQKQKKIMNYLYIRYRTLLSRALAYRGKVMLLLMTLCLIGLGLFHFMPAELTPQEDMNTVYVMMAAPRNASFSYTDGYAKRMEAVYRQFPDIVSTLSISGMMSPSHAFQILMLKPPAKRHYSLENLMTALSAAADDFAGVRVNVFAPTSPIAEVVGGEEGGDLGMVLMTTNDYTTLQSVSQKIVNEIRKQPGFLHVNNSLRWDGEDFRVNVNQERAADLHVSPAAVGDMISILVAGRKLGKSDDQTIYLQMSTAGLEDPNIFQQIYVRNSDGAMIPLSSVATIQTVASSDVYGHYSRLRSDNINLTRAPQFKLDDAIRSLRTIAQQNLPPGVKYTFTGEAKSFLDSDSKMFNTFLLALVFIYLVMAAQFESFVDPLIIILTVPFAIIGALLTMYCCGGTLNIYSDIGLITLIGLIAKHGILITEFANQLRRRGLSIDEAVLEAAVLRLRPILMTTAAMVLGALPLAFAFGPGSENRQQIGMVIVGGMLVGTVFSLIIVPITYTFLGRLKNIQPDVIEPEEDKVHAVSI